MPHTYQDSPSKEQAKGIARWLGGQRTHHEDLCRVVLHSSHGYPSTILPEAGRSTGEDAELELWKAGGMTFRKPNKRGQSAGSQNTSRSQV